MTETKSTVGLAVGIMPERYLAAEMVYVGWVRLAVSDLKQSLEFYSGILGLRVADIGEKWARLTAQGDEKVLVELVEEPGLKPLNGPRLGLFHVAILLPRQLTLSSFVNHLVSNHVKFGAGDHIYSEAIYLTDPDGLGIEVYADRPREGWPVAERLVSGEKVLEYAADTQALRFNELPAAEKWEGAPKGTRIGHVHLSVGDLADAARFYHQGLGLAAMTWNYPGALFVSAGGYHHHVGLNTWSAGAPSAGASDPRLLYWTLMLPSEAEVERSSESLRRMRFEAVAIGDGSTAELPGIAFKDPWGTVVVLVTEGSAV